jgi:hypothetical protein
MVGMADHGIFGSLAAVTDCKNYLTQERTGKGSSLKNEGKSGVFLQILTAGKAQ